MSKEAVRPTMVEITTKKHTEKRKHLENKLNENTETMKKLKKNYKIVNFKVFCLVNKRNLTNMLYIQLPYGYVKNNEQVQFNLLNNYEESFYLKQAPYLTNHNLL